VYVRYWILRLNRMLGFVDPIVREWGDGGGVAAAAVGPVRSGWEGEMRGCAESADSSGAKGFAECSDAMLRCGCGVDGESEGVRLDGESDDCGGGEDCDASASCDDVVAD
jgi:hypothetical protein